MPSVLRFTGRRGLMKNPVLVAAVASLFSLTSSLAFAQVATSAAAGSQQTPAAVTESPRENTRVGDGKSPDDWRFAATSTSRRPMSWRPSWPNAGSPTHSCPSEVRGHRSLRPARSHPSAGQPCLWRAAPNHFRDRQGRRDQGQAVRGNVPEAATARPRLEDAGRSCGRAAVARAMLAIPKSCKR